MPLAKVAPESFGRPRSALGLLAFLVDNAAHELLHRDADRLGLAFSHDLAAGSMSRNCDARTHGGGSSGHARALRSAYASELCCQVGRSQKRSGRSERRTGRIGHKRVAGSGGWGDSAWQGRGPGQGGTRKILGKIHSSYDMKQHGAHGATSSPANSPTSSASTGHPAIASTASRNLRNSAWIGSSSCEGRTRPCQGPISRRWRSGLWRRRYRRSRLGAGVDRTGRSRLTDLAARRYSGGEA